MWEGRCGELKRMLECAKREKESEREREKEAEEQTQPVEPIIYPPVSPTKQHSRPDSTSNKELTILSKELTLQSAHIKNLEKSNARMNGEIMVLKSKVCFPSIC